MELIGPEFGEEVRHYSPVKTLGITPLGKGNGRFELEFFHANYPEGVQGKFYTIQTIERKRNYMLGRVIDTERIVLLFDLNEDWLKAHFGARNQSGESAERWVEKYFFRSSGSQAK